MELCGISVNFPLDGQSLTTLMKEGKDANRVNMSYSYFNKGITMRNERYRITRYFRGQEPTIELYDHQHDPLETKNIAADNPDVVASLLPKLENGNTGLYGD